MRWSCSMTMKLPVWSRSKSEKKQAFSIGCSLRTMNFRPVWSRLKVSSPTRGGKGEDLFLGVRTRARPPTIARGCLSILHRFVQFTPRQAAEGFLCSHWHVSVHPGS
jgi:hypothetical protein